ncbi:WD40-repeat-containing domain protein [Lipomyces arxii]|uniref:WD40-repeat-containing domain protein n=1 Tax=Lipomyces arxii TaxID=56418 RepID=UPI0034CEABB7
MDQRRAEIQAKKARLAELRYQREMRKQNRAVNSNPGSPVKGEGAKNDVDELIANLTSSVTKSNEYLDEKEEEKDKMELTSWSFDVFDVAPFLPAETVKTSYSKAVQTDSYVDAVIETVDTVERMENVNTMNVVSTAEYEEEVYEAKNEKEEGMAKYLEMDQNAKKDLFLLDAFTAFMNKSTKIVERALEDDYDVLVDYAAVEKDDRQARSEWELHQVGNYVDSKSESRNVTSIDWSPKYPELFAVSYSQPTTGGPIGLVQVWNTRLHDRSEYDFYSKSEVMCIKFSPFHANILTGGCYNGQVLVWDMRAGQDAILKTPISGIGHAHPVHAIEFIGTKNANSIITASSDGRVCTWSADFLARPQEVFDLKLPPPSRTEDLAPTCLGLHATDQSYFVVGTEDGNVYTCNRESRAGLQTGLDFNLTYIGQGAPVTGISFHPSQGPVDLSNLFLTAGLDWNVKLWRTVKPGGERAGELMAEFASEDLVYDVAWSPVRPGVFASVTGNGALDVWDLAIDVEVPVASIKSGPRSLNKVAWEKTDGKFIALGGLGSGVSVFSVGTGLGGGANAQAEEWKAMRRLWML